MHQVLTVNLLSQPKVFMSSRIKICLLGILASIGSVFTAFAQKQLQDNFVLEKTWTNKYAIPNGYTRYGLAVDSSNRVYVADGSRVVIYDLTGTALQTWAVASAVSVGIHPTSNLVFVGTSASTNQIKVFDTNGTLIRQWGGSGSGNGQFSLQALSISSSGVVYVADNPNYRVEAFDINGNYLFQWGSYGSAGNQFGLTADITVGIDGTVYVADWFNFRIQQFQPDGTFLRQYIPVAGQWPKIVNAGPDGTVYSATYQGDLRLLSSTLDYITSFNYGAYGSNARTYGAAFSPDGQRLVILADIEVRVFRRVYHTGGLKPPNAIPLPVVANTAQRSGTQWIDVDFSVVDSDNATVQVGAVGFMDGRQDLLAAVPMKSFTNGTDVVSWTNVTTGVKHHLTWDALTDWFALYGNLKINILAKDNRNLMDFHLITIPTNTSYATPVNISVSPYGHADFLGVWTWLIATREPSVNLATGSVYAVGNLYGVTNNTLLAYTQIASGQTNTLTTSDGRTFLFSMISSNMVSTVYSNLIVRVATSNEIYRATMGTTHTNLTTITKWTPLVQINGLPISVNEYGFDTGSITAGGGLPNNAWWVVLAPPGQ